MSRLVIDNGTVLTMDDARTVHFGGHVVIEGDRITAVGPGRYEAGGGEADTEVIDASGDGRVEVYVGIEWLPLASPELLRDARTLADELGTGIHVHLNESLTEVENSKERFGRRPTEVAYDAGLLGRRTIAAHCVWLS